MHVRRHSLLVSEIVARTMPREFYRSCGFLRSALHLGSTHHWLILNNSLDLTRIPIMIRSKTEQLGVRNASNWNCIHCFSARSKFLVSGCNASAWKQSAQSTQYCERNP